MLGTPVPRWAGKSRRDIVEQRPLAERLGQIGDNAGGQRSLAVRLGRAAGDQDRGYLISVRQQALVQLKPAHSGHPDIRYQASGLAKLFGGEELLRRRECGGFQTMRGEDALQCSTDRLVVIDDRDQRFHSIGPRKTTKAAPELTRMPGSTAGREPSGRYG